MQKIAALVQRASIEQGGAPSTLLVCTYINLCSYIKGRIVSTFVPYNFRNIFCVYRSFYDLFLKVVMIRYSTHT